MADFELDIERRIYESASTLVHRGRWAIVRSSSKR